MRYCPQCNLPEDQMDTCSRPAFGSQFQCPEVAEADDAKMVRVECKPCGKAFAFPASKAMKGSSALATCQLGECAAQFVLAVAEAPAAPAMDAAPLDAAPMPAPKARTSKKTANSPSAQATEAVPPSEPAADPEAPATTEEARASDADEAQAAG